MPATDWGADAVQQQPGLLSRKRKEHDAPGEPLQPTVKARLAEPQQPNVKAKLVAPVAGAAKETGAAANRTGEATNEATPLADEKIEHARSKISELERQLQESELRKSKALERLSEYAGQTKTYGSLHKKLVLLRFFLRASIKPLSRSRLRKRSCGAAALCWGRRPCGGWRDCSGKESPADS